MMTAGCFRDYASTSGGGRDATPSPPHLLQNWRRLLSGILGELLQSAYREMERGGIRMNETRVKSLSMGLINP
jgi:hypothetical protein